MEFGCKEKKRMNGWTPGGVQSSKNVKKSFGAVRTLAKEILCGRPLFRTLSMAPQPIQLKLKLDHDFKQKEVDEKSLKILNQKFQN